MADRVREKIKSVFYNEQLQGRMHLNNSAFELALQAFTNCLHMCETWHGLSDLKYEVVGNIGWINRLIGRYDIAIQNLQEALRLCDVEPPTLERVQIETELGTVYRLTDRHDEARAVFTRQYSRAKRQIAELEKNGDTEGVYSWKRVACRAVGNLGLANYQRALRLMSEAKNPDTRDAKQTAKDRINHAIGQLRERVRLAREIEADSETPLGRSHGRNSRLSQAICWQCIGYSRLSLCHSALADLESGEEASYEIVTPAIRLAMEPSAEHRGYLGELVAAGADFESIDPKTGYTALDYAIFSGDVQTQEIVIDGLRRQHRARTGNSLPNRKVECLKQEARLKKGYREIFQEKLRPELMKAGQGIHRWEQDEKETARNRVTRRQALRHLRRVYAAALDADKDMGALFDRLKVITYKDFVEFGRLPRSSDGLAKTFDVAVSSLGRDGSGPKDDDKDQGEVVLFFSYRWINRDPNRSSPDDANRTQYKRMVDAVKSYVKNQNGLISIEQVLIWMDFACVDQDNPTAGVSALPLLISQCDAVITLQDDTYFDRAWCCVEADMIQTLRDEYYLHEWFEQVPYNTSYEEQTGSGIEDVQCDRDYETSKREDGVIQWQLRSAKDKYNLNTGEKKLSRESDRPKVLFLERQTSLLKWSPG